MKPLFLFLTVLAVTAFSSLAKAPKPLNGLNETLTAAANENKMTFILLGRATCGNCNATKSMISKGQVFVTDKDYVMADLNCDDAKVKSRFMKKFGKVKFGNTLPFVVVTDSQGGILASSGGFKNAAEWNNLLKAAKSKANKSANTSGTNSQQSWPFSSPVPTNQ